MNTPKTSAFVETTRSDQQEPTSATLPEGAPKTGTDMSEVRVDPGNDTSTVGKLGTDPYVLKSK